MSISYREIIKKSWQITWNNKILWFFGFFAMSLLGNNRAYKLILDNFDALGRQDLTNYYNYRAYGQALLSGKGIMGVFSGWSGIGFMSFISSIIIFALIAFVVIAVVWLSIISQIAIIKGIQKASLGKKLYFKELIGEAKEYFWPVLGLNLLAQVAIFALFFIFIYPAVTYAPFFSNATTILFLLFFLLFVPLSLTLAFLIIYASSCIILKNQSLKKSLGSAWKLFYKNWLPSLEMTILLFLLDIAAAIGLAITVLLLAIPFGLLAIIFYFILGNLGLAIIAVVSIIFLLVLVILFTSALTTFQYSAWTVLFLRLGDKGASGKIVEALSSVGAYLKEETK